MAADALHLAAAAVYVAVRLTVMQRHKAAYGPFGKASVHDAPA
jgi:hypothetical protein